MSTVYFYRKQHRQRQQDQQRGRQGRRADRGGSDERLSVRHHQRRCGWGEPHTWGEAPASPFRAKGKSKNRHTARRQTESRAGGRCPVKKSGDEDRIRHLRVLWKYLDDNGLVRLLEPLVCRCKVQRLSDLKTLDLSPLGVDEGTQQRLQAIIALVP